MKFSDAPNLALSTRSRGLIYTWDEDRLIFELTPTGTAGCAVTLTNVHVAARQAAAGSHGCLGELTKHAPSAATGRSHSAGRRAIGGALLGVCELGPAGAPIPGQ